MGVGGMGGWPALLLLGEVIRTRATQGEGPWADGRPALFLIRLFGQAAVGIIGTNCFGHSNILVTSFICIYRLEESITEVTLFESGLEGLIGF